MSSRQLARWRRARRVLTGSLAALVVAGGAATTAQAAEIDVTAAPYAAAGDGSTNDRVAIQQAIDDQSAAGGGTVVLKSGRTFVSGDLRLKQGVELRIDGVLEQSQQVAHYSRAPTLGHYNARGDLANFTNLPLVFASHTQDVSVSGSGRIQMTLASGGLDETIQISAIGFYEVTDYVIRDVAIHEGHVYHVMLYGTRSGLVDSIHIRSPEPDPVTGAIEANTDGISLQNSSDIRITGSRIETDDDSLYIWSSYLDPRGGEDTWWRANPRPSRNIRIDNNTLQAGHNGHGFAFIAWGASAPDQSQVEISDVVLEDNLIEGGPPYGYAVGCWCQDPYNKAPWTGSGYGDQSPITRVTFRGNTYPQGQIRPMLISDLTTDFPMLSAGTSLNGDFASADAAWNRTGSTGVATGAELPAEVGGADARTASERMDGRFGWVAGGAQRSAFSQVLGLGGAAPLAPLGLDGTYRVSAEVATGGDAVLFVRNLCTQETVIGKALPAGTRGRQTATFRLAADCGRVEIGVALAAGANGWALLDDFQVKAPMMHALDPGILYAGYWAPHREPGEWRGSHMSSASPGQTAIITFNGTRARVVGLQSQQIGIIRFSVDGGPAQEVDLFSPTLRLEQVLFDTGTLPAGEHTIKVEPTGDKNPAATYTAFAFDGVLVDEPALTINRPRLDFGSVPVESRQTKHVTLVASDAGTVAVGEVTLAGAAPEQFDVDASACSGRQLPAGGSCTLAIAFAPTADGDHRAVVRVDGPGGVQEIGLAGETPDGYPLSERFSDVIDDRDPRASQTGAWGNTYQYAEDIGGYHLVGFDTSAVVKARFTGTRVTIWATTDFNLGTADVFIDGEHAGVADFVSPQAVRGTSVFDSELLEPGEHEIEMRTRSGLSVFDAFLVSGGTTAAADRAAIDFGSVTAGEQSAVEQVTVTAGGTGRLKIGGVRLVGAQAGDFALTGGSCARDTVLESGESCTARVRFAPGAATGERSAKLRIADTSDAGATVVALTAVARAVPPVDRRDDEERRGGDDGRGGGEQPPTDGPAPNPPGDGDPIPTPPGGDRTAGPALTKLSLSAKRVQAGRALGLRFTSSKPARLTVVLERRIAGRVAGGRCRTGKSAPARGRRCVVFRAVRTLRASARAGANRVSVPTRAGKRALPAGGYRLRLTAVDAEGRRTTPKPLVFTVRRR
jgi:hypothetical protein